VARDPVLSILVSSYNRLPLFRRTLWAVAHRPPRVPFEVVVADDGSTEDVLGELRLYSARFPWTFVRFDRGAFERATGLTKFHNNPAVTQNLAARHARGALFVQQGNEVIVWGDCYDRLVADIPSRECPHGPGDGCPCADYWMVMSTTYDVPPQYLDGLDPYGANLTQAVVDRLVEWPLQSAHYRSDVTNYASLCPRRLWEDVGGFDERYHQGIACEDSDFVRRARALPGFRQVVSAGVSLHQSHRGRTRYYAQDHRVISNARWDEGVARNRAVYDAWDGRPANPMKWAWGAFGTGEVLTNWRGS
jgi:glycosyltransferase involved in cell wall biosynthesis